MKRCLCALLLLLLLPLAARAQTLADYDYENLQFRGIGVEFGGIWPNDMQSTASFGVRADMGFVGPHIRIEPAIRYWSTTMDQSEVDRLGEQIVKICERQVAASCPTALDLGEVRRSDLELSADAHYLFGSPATVTPYAGAGLSLHLLNGRGELINDTFVQDLLDTLAPGVNLLGGVNVPVFRRVQLMAEARMALTTDVQSATLLIGGTWTFPSPPPNPFRGSDGGGR
ncbi:MAG TPA: hypothetical protein VFI96_02675 [Longimicrobiaceae bacterium]|nr:hypothetical protein [Longimicrobiaceae bacterium]